MSENSLVMFSLGTVHTELQMDAARHLIWDDQSCTAQLHWVTFSFSPSPCLVSDRAFSVSLISIRVSWQLVIAKPSQADLRLVDQWLCVYMFYMYESYFFLFFQLQTKLQIYSVYLDIHRQYKSN